MLARSPVDGMQTDVQLWPAGVPPRQLQLDRLRSPVALPRFIHTAVPSRLPCRRR